MITKKILVHRLSLLAKATKTEIDDVLVGVLASTHFLFVLILAAYLSSNLLELTTVRQSKIFHAFLISLMIQVAVWGDKAIRLGLAQYLQKNKAEDVASTTSTAALGFVSRVTLWIVIILVILDNLGFNIATLIASLGIGGIAVALALQSILGDLFASLSIVLDKPFSVGDFIVVDDVFGTVEFIGLKTTRLRSLTRLVCAPSAQKITPYLPEITDDSPASTTRATIARSRRAIARSYELPCKSYLVC